MIFLPCLQFGNGKTIDGNGEESSDRRDPNSLGDSLQQPEVQVVLVAVEEALVVGEDQVPGVVTPVDDVGQLYAVGVTAVGAVSEVRAHIFPPGPEPAAAPIQAVVNLK